MSFDWSKISFNLSKQTEAHKKKKLDAISIDQKTNWINRNFGKKQHFRKNNLVFEKIPQSIEYNE